MRLGRGGGSGPSKEEALRAVAPERLDTRELRVALDAFDGHAEPEAAGDADDGCHDGLLGRPAVEFGGEGAVDLEPVDVQAAEVRERRVAGAEVVERKADAHVP